MQAMQRTKIANVSPLPGDLVLKPGNNEMMVWSGFDWVTCTNPFNEISENYFRLKFEEEETEIHKSHSQLKELWDEYKILRRLLIGS